MNRGKEGREREKEKGKKEKGRVGRRKGTREGGKATSELRQSEEGKRAGMGGRRGWGKLPTAVMKLQVFLPESRLTARVGRGRAGLHPLSPQYFRGKGMGAGPKVEGWPSLYLLPNRPRPWPLWLDSEGGKREPEAGQAAAL